MVGVDAHRDRGTGSTTPDPRPDLSADDLRFLLAVARSGRLMAAANTLGVEHTTVRRRLDRLEAALGARVLERSAEGWELTALGRGVVERALQVEELIGEVGRLASGREEGVHGTVRLVAPEGFALCFGVPAIERVRRQHPLVQVELVTSTRALSVRGAGFDVAVTVGPHGGSGVRSESLAPYALRLYAARDYLGRHAAVEQPADLRAHRLVYYVDALITVPELDLAPQLGSMASGFSSTSVAAQLEATRRGAGIGLLHAFMADKDPDLVPVLADFFDFRLQFALATRRDSSLGAAVSAMRTALFQEVSERASELVPD
jgi:DNA-binding transcriptional LysR family regulator